MIASHVHHDSIPCTLLKGTTGDPRELRGCPNVVQQLQKCRAPSKCRGGESSRSSRGGGGGGAIEGWRGGAPEQTFAVRPRPPRASAPSAPSARRRRRSRRTPVASLAGGRARAPQVSSPNTTGGLARVLACGTMRTTSHSHRRCASAPTLSPSVVNRRHRPLFMGEGTPGHDTWGRCGLAVVSISSMFALRFGKPEQAAP